MANKFYQARFRHGKIPPTPSDGYLAPCSDEDVAGDGILDDIRNNNKTNFVNAVHACVLTRPGITYADLQNFLVDHGVNCTQPVVDASEVDINVQQTLTDLQGSIEKIYPIHLDFLPSTTDVGTRRRLHAIVPSKHLVAAGHVISRNQLPAGTGTESQSTVPTDDCDAFTGWLVEGDPVTPGSPNANGQPPLAVAAPKENTISVGSGADQSCASSELHAPSPTAPSPLILPAQPAVPTQSLALRNNTAVFTMSASFNVNAYSSVSANAHSESVVKDAGGLVLPEIISSDSELWAQAKRAIIQRLRLTNVGYGASAGIRCILDPPPLMGWMGGYTLGRFRNCCSRIVKAANPAGAQHRLDAHQIMAKMGLRPNEGGFDPAASTKIANSLNHMIKHMMWAFDLVKMQKNNYEHFVPADRYRFTRMLGLMPDGKIPIEFDIISTDGPNKGQKIGLWKGTLDQLSWDKGDQRKIPNNIQCELLVKEIFGEVEADDRANLVRLGSVEVRECFADENVDLRACYEKVLALRG
ncbi:hypothetical protein INS49_011959 [Diaporthe citri]|uniref:uncharacterized protein n=1 Tax=Diaporthe citri TaxID=83186 RepID=UPI001C8188F6|nr:uncharacterized protein INS49_011959 [Diaporthe citri]KAG6360891.1 hypothetical protein INS49_011959 [Diaporthe citri]